MSVAVAVLILIVIAFGGGVVVAVGHSACFSPIIHSLSKLPRQCFDSRSIGHATWLQMDCGN